VGADAAHAVSPEKTGFRRSGRRRAHACRLAPDQRDLYFSNTFHRTPFASLPAFKSPSLPPGACVAARISVVSRQPTRGARAKSMDRPIIPIKEVAMSRKYIDCREFPSEMNCTVALSADSDNELLEAAVQHAVTVHKHADSPELRAQLKTLFHEGTPPVQAPRA